jgi:hypothetical protein
MADLTEEIKRVIDKAYLDGIQNWGDPDVIRRHVVPEFVMLMLVDSEIQSLPIETWIENIQRQKAAHPDGPPHPATVRYLEVDVTGNAAMVKLELYRLGRKQFTDSLALYRFEEGWRIVGKHSTVTERCRRAAHPAPLPGAAPKPAPRCQAPGQSTIPCTPQSTSRTLRAQPSVPIGPPPVAKTRHTPA